MESQRIVDYNLNAQDLEAARILFLMQVSAQVQKNLSESSGISSDQTGEIEDNLAHPSKSSTPETLRDEEDMIKELVIENSQMERSIKKLCSEVKTLEAKLSKLQNSKRKSGDAEVTTRKRIKRESNSENYYEQSDQSDEADDSDDSEDQKATVRKKLVPIGSGYAKVPENILKTLSNNYTKATRALLKAIFPRKVLATHSMTGKQSPAFPGKPAKKRLNPDLVADIVETVSERCNVPASQVRTCITNKCADESKMRRAKLKKMCR